MALSDSLKPVIQLIDNLKDCGIDSKISLPRIVVIGTQSAGKSSLLESIVGLDFLPRGDGVVTRIPLELRLIHVNEDEFETYAEFADERDTKYTEFSKITAMIEEKTNLVAGKSKGIVNKPITLTVYSRECPTLTLIDLPGITKVPMKNSDQPEDIGVKTIEMTREFIKDPRTIILCVIPANNDISTSDALLLAREVDKEGKRTLGVLTKVDIMDKGTSALPILRNEVIQLTHGYVAVKNRSQADIKNNVKVRDALEAEEKYFENHREFRNVPDMVGTTVLSKKLCNLLHNHIVHCLPQIEEEIANSIKDLDKTLQSLGTPFPQDNGSKLYYLLSKAKEVSENVQDIMEGKLLLPQKNKCSQFQGYAYFNLLVSKFSKEKNEIFVNNLKDLPPTQVILDIVDFKGLALPGSFPKEIIENKVKSELDKLKIPTTKFVEEIYDHIEKILKYIFDNMVSVSGGGKKLLHRIALDFLENQKKEALDLLVRVIEVEKDMVWTSDYSYFLKDNAQTSQQSSISNYEHPNANLGTIPNQDYKLNKSLQFIKNEISSLDFSTIKKHIDNFLNYLQGKTELKTRLDQIVKNKLNIANLVTEEEVVYFYEKLIRYYNIVNRNLSDTIPKIVGAIMIKRYFAKLEDFFQKTISENMEQLTKIQEDANLNKKREICTETLDKLLKSKDILKRFHFETEL